MQISRSKILKFVEEQIELYWKNPAQGIIPAAACKIKDRVQNEPISEEGSISSQRLPFLLGDYDFLIPKLEQFVKSVDEGEVSRAFQRATERGGRSSDLSETRWTRTVQKRTIGCRAAHA
jgi:hypothetical protein